LAMDGGVVLSVVVIGVHCGMAICYNCRFRGVRLPGGSQRVLNAAKP
jgi:hypothetical protein